MVIAVPGSNYIGNGANDWWNKWIAYVNTFHSGDSNWGTQAGDLAKTQDLTTRDLLLNAENEYNSAFASSINADHLLISDAPDPLGLIPMTHTDLAAREHDINLPLATNLQSQFLVNTLFAIRGYLNDITYNDPFSTLEGVFIFFGGNTYAYYQSLVTQLGNAQIGDIVVTGHRQAQVYIVNIASPSSLGVFFPPGTLETKLPHIVIEPGTDRLVLGLMGPTSNPSQPTSAEQRHDLQGWADYVGSGDPSGLPSTLPASEYATAIDWE